MGRIKARQKKMQHIARLLDIPGQAGPPSPAYIGGGIYATRGVGRGSRDNKSLFCTNRGPGFATPRRESAPAVTDSLVATTSGTSRSRARDGDSPGRFIPSDQQKRLEKNGSAKSRESSSGRNNRSRDGSPRMPRPRSEEIPLELIKKSQCSTSDTSPKISILPRPQQISRTDSEIAVTSASASTEASAVPATVTAQEKSEETSFIAAQQDKRLSRRKGVIETV